MSKEKTEKTFFRLEPKFEEILASADGDTSPFIETFVFQGENVSQENLGTIAGILEVGDESEESSYIVNYIISVIKKEYFASPKRGAIESFESAMHKANLALSKLAEHGSIGWIGNLNAAITVVEKNSILFTQTGKARVFLLRSQNLMDIFEQGEEEVEETPNPLKTFQDVVTGRVEEKDKVILATDSVFSIFSREEIKKSALKFSDQDFLRFMKTALINELEKAAVLVVDVKKKEIRQSEVAEKKEKINAFSQTSFAKKRGGRKGDSAPLREEERQKVIQGIKEEYEKTKGEFVDKKTGHIYIKEDALEQEKKDEAETLKNYGQKIISGGVNILSSIKEKSKLKTPSQEGDDRHLEIRREEKNSEPLLPRIIIFLEFFFVKVKVFLLAVFGLLSTGAVFLWQKILLPAVSSGQEFFLKTFAKRSYIKNKLRQIGKNQSQMPASDFSDSYPIDHPSREEKRNWFSQLSQRKTVPGSRPEIRLETRQNGKDIFDAKIIPDFSKIKSAYSSLGKKGKAAAFASLILIFVVPYFIAGFMEKRSQKEIETPQSFPAIEETIPLKEDRDVIRLIDLAPSSLKNAYLGMINLNGKFFAAGKSGVFSLEDQAEFPWPEDFSEPEICFGMKDLNLIFFLKRGRMVSFSAVSQKFQTENIDISSEAEIVSGGSFMTYVYLLDKNSGQIYRYPRAEGGFGAKTAWLKENINLFDATEISVNENIFISEKGKILKLFQGKTESFQVEESATPILADEIYVETENENIYLLDKTNSRIVSLDGAGKILKQYYNSFFKNASDLAIDKKKGLVYISSESGVRSFNLN